MKRKEFLHMAGMGMMGSLVIPQLPFGARMIDPLEALEGGMDPATKKQLADVALNAARSGGATYADVRIGRYLNQLLSPVRSVCRTSRMPSLSGLASGSSPADRGDLPPPMM